MNIDTLNYLYKKTSSLIESLEMERDHGDGLDKEGEKILKHLNEYWDHLREHPEFYEPELTEWGEVVDIEQLITSDWIRKKMEEKGISGRKLADLVNTSEFQISKWISGDRNPSGAAKAALYYALR